MHRFWTLMAVLAVACGSGAPPPPASPDGGSPVAETITGRERIGWAQQASGEAELATFRYAIYVDGTRSEIAGVTCSGGGDGAGFACSGALPPMTNGLHTLELASFVTRGDAILESGRSQALRVSVAALTAPAAEEWRGGEMDTTRDGVTLRADKLAEGLHSPVDAAFAGDSLLIAERAGAIRVFAAGRLQSTDALRLDADRTPPQILSVAVDPDYPRTHFVYTVQTATTADGGAFQLARYRELRGRLAERAVLFETRVPAPGDSSSAVVRFGPDRKMYVALGGLEGDGRLVRLNADGSMPRDQAGTTPAIAGGLDEARGLDWDPQSNTLWIADSRGGEAHLSAVSVSAPPVRASVRARHGIHGAVGSLEFYTNSALAAMRGDALLGSAEGYIFRLRFSPGDPTRVEWSERLFDRGANPVRVVTVSADGAIYFCTDSALGRLVSVH